MYTQNSRKGLYVVIEGPDGCGKTTMATKLIEWVRENYNDKEVIYVREPGGIKPAEKIRDILLSTELDDRSRFLLFVASRSINIVQTIIPALDAGKIIICDRGSRSTFVYQGFADRNASDSFSSWAEKTRMFRTIETYAIHGCLPDMEFLMSVDPEEAWRRSHTRDKEVDVLEAQGYEWFKKINKLYNVPCTLIPYTTYIDANASPDIVFDQLKEHLARLIEQKFGDGDVSDS